MNQVHKDWITSPWYNWTGQVKHVWLPLPSKDKSKKKIQSQKGQQENNCRWEAATKPGRWKANGPAVTNRRTRKLTWGKTAVKGALAPKAWGTSQLAEQKAQGATPWHPLSTQGPLSLPADLLPYKLFAAGVGDGTLQMMREGTPSDSVCRNWAGQVIWHFRGHHRGAGGLQDASQPALKREFTSSW